MRRIRSKDTRPELTLRRALHGRGFRYRLHRADLPGKPDLLFTKARLAVFVNGCFWHQHPGCRYATRPKTHRSYWGPKLRRNTERDIEHEQALRVSGYNVIVVWECQIAQDLDSVLLAIVSLVTA